MTRCVRRDPGTAHVPFGARAHHETSAPALFTPARTGPGFRCIELGGGCSPSAPLMTSRVPLTGGTADERGSPQHPASIRAQPHQSERIHLPAISSQRTFVIPSAATMRHSEAKPRNLSPRRRTPASKDPAAGVRHPPLGCRRREIPRSARDDDRRVPRVHDPATARRPAEHDCQAAPVQGRSQCCARFRKDEHSVHPCGIRRSGVG
jgi:hypothetical protein